MIAKALTTYRLDRLRPGDEVYYRGARYAVFGLFQTSVLLESMEVTGKLIVKVTHDQINAYTLELRDASLAFSHCMTEHRRLVAARRYTSTYWARPKLTVYDRV